MKRVLTILLCLLAGFPSLMGQERDTLLTVDAELTDAYLDTVNVRKRLDLNNYSTFGIQYGYGLNQTSFNPTKRQGLLYTPMNVGIVFTHYEKLFGYLPYFGLQVGFFKGQDGYKFKQDDEGEWQGNVDGATQCTFDYVEIPAMALGHLDMWHFKLMVGGGFYGAYRYKIQRTGEPSLGFDEAFATSFKDYEHKLDYGWTVTAGLGLVFDPIEFHVTGRLRYGLGSLYDPDYYSEYYYRFAGTMDIIISAGIHIQLTKRSGKTTGQLRRQAREMIYNPQP